MGWVHVWIHRGWGGYRYGYREGGVGTGMDTQRVGWVHVWIIRGWGGYRYGYLEGGVGTGMDT